MNFDFSDIYLFKWPELFYSELENEIGLTAFNLLNQNQEEALVGTKSTFEKQISEDEVLNNLEDDMKENYYTQMFTREELALNELQRIQRYSLCLSLYSFFEGRLKDICDKIESKFNFKIKIDDLNGSDDILKYWNYLAKVYEMDMHSLEKYYTPIKQHKKIRNIIAHQGGYATAVQKSKIEISEGLSLVQVDDTHQIVIDGNKYIKFLLNQMRGFLDEMLLAVDNKYKEKMQD